MPGAFPFIDELPNVRYQLYVLADGKRMRVAMFDPEKDPRGTFVIAPGRREFLEKKYYEAGRDLIARGFRVIMFEWRGQGLSGRNNGAARQRDHANNFDIHLGDLRGLYRDIIKPNRTGPLFICAHSMGALIIARWLAENPETRLAINACIFTGPAFAIGVPPLSFTISRLMCALGKSGDYASMQGDYGTADKRFDGNPLSHDPARFALMEKYFDLNPELAIGGVTWGWLRAALKVMRTMRRPGYLKRVPMPVLALIGSRDIVTPPGEVVPILQRLPRAEIAVVPGALHDIMNEADTYRNQAWTRIDAFIKRVMSA